MKVKVLFCDANRLSTKHKDIAWGIFCHLIDSIVKGALISYEGIHWKLCVQVPFNKVLIQQSQITIKLWWTPDMWKLFFSILNNLYNSKPFFHCRTFLLFPIIAYTFSCKLKLRFCDAQFNVCSYFAVSGKPTAYVFKAEL